VAVIKPARRRGRRVVRVGAGDIHRAMGLKDRMPAVCGAIDAAVFQEQAGVKLARRHGPSQGATAQWEFELE